MNKKVLSAILFSALFACTGTFTSCIDNDEPAGIEELRGAKAELLRAKVAVEQAQAALTLAKAETEKALAAKGQAEARIKEAEAKIKEAQAAAEEAETEALKAEYAKNAAFWQQEMAKAAILHEKSILELKGQLAEAQRTYELTLVKVAVAKKLFPLDSTFTLDALETSVTTWTDAVDSLSEVVAEKQAIYDSLATDYKYFGKLDSDSLQMLLDQANAGLATQKATLAKYENWLEEDVTTKDWRAEVEELAAQIDSLTKYEANIKLDSALAHNSTEYKALLAAQTEANKAATVDSVYGYKYFGDANATTLYFDTNADTTMMSGDVVIAEAAAKKALVVDALDTIARYDAAGTLLAGKLYDDKQALASFTAEVKHYLDAIAAAKTEADTIYKYNSNVAIKAWSDTLTMYKNANDSVTIKKTAAETAKTALASSTAAKPGRYDAFRLALLDYYKAAVKNGATLNKLPVQIKGAALNNGSAIETTVTTAEDMITVLSDKTKGNNTLYLLDSLNTSYDYFNTAASAAADTAHVDYTAADGKAAECKYTTKAFAKVALTKAEMYASLVRASDHAFGKAELYLQTGDYVGTHAPSTPYDESKYLHVQPDSADVMNVVFFNGFDNDDVHIAVANATSGKVGEYGKFLIAKNDEVKAYALTYKDRIKNLEGAITYWEATYKTLSAKFTAWETAKNAADEAVADYKKANLDSTAKKLEELSAEIGRLGRIQEALQTAIGTYLPKALDGSEMSYTAAEAFKITLDGIVAIQKMAVNRAERAAAAAQKAVELNEYELYSSLTEAEIELNDAIAELKDAQAELEEALADIAEALEIYEATVTE